MVCRVVRYCTVSMATASSRIRCNSWSVCGKSCVAETYPEKLRGVCRNHVLDFISNPFAATYPRARGWKTSESAFRGFVGSMHERRETKSIHLFGAVCIARMSNASMIRWLATTKARRKMISTWKKVRNESQSKKPLMPAHSVTNSLSLSLWIFFPIINL